MKRFSFPALSATVIALSGISLILRVICMLSFYNNGYYRSGAALPILANVFFIIAIAIFLLASILCVKRTTQILAPSKLARYAAILPMSASVFCAAQTITSLTAKGAAESSSGFLPVATLLCAVVSAIFFFLIFFAPKQINATVYCGLGAIALVFFLWISSYFDFSSPINSADRNLFYVSCAGAMLFIFNELCAIYGSVKPRFYCFSIFSAIFALASSAIPTIIGFATNKIDSYSNLEGDVLFAALLVYATARLITLASASKSDVAETDVNVGDEEKTEEKVEEPVEESAKKEAE